MRDVPSRGLDTRGWADIKESARMLLSDLRLPDDDIERAAIEELALRPPECNVGGVVIDRHVWMGGWICKRCGARKGKTFTPRVKAK